MLSDPVKTPAPSLCLFDYQRGFARPLAMRCAFAPRLSWLWRLVPRALLVHGVHVDDRLLSVLVPVVFLLQHLLRLQVLIDTL